MDGLLLTWWPAMLAWWLVFLAGAGGGWLLCSFLSRSQAGTDEGPSPLLKMRCHRCGKPWSGRLLCRGCASSLVRSAVMVRSAVIDDRTCERCAELDGTTSWPANACENVDDDGKTDCRCVVSGWGAARQARAGPPTYVKDPQPLSPDDVEAIRRAFNDGRNFVVVPAGVDLDAVDAKAREIIQSLRQGTTIMAPPRGVMAKAAAIQRDEELDSPAVRRSVMAPPPGKPQEEPCPVHDCPVCPGDDDDDHHGPHGPCNGTSPWCKP